MGLMFYSHLLRVFACWRLAQTPDGFRWNRSGLISRALNY